MGEAYPELQHARSKVEGVLLREGERFSKTLDQGLKMLDRELSSLSGDVLPGEIAFRCTIRTDFQWILPLIFCGNEI